MNISLCCRQPHMAVSATPAKCPMLALEEEPRRASCSLAQRGHRISDRISGTERIVPIPTLLLPRPPGEPSRFPRSGTTCILGTNVCPLSTELPVRQTLNCVGNQLFLFRYMPHHRMLISVRREANGASIIRLHVASGIKQPATYSVCRKMICVANVHSRRLVSDFPLIHLLLDHRQPQVPLTGLGGKALKDSRCATLAAGNRTLRPRTDRPAGRCLAAGRRCNGPGYAGSTWSGAAAAHRPARTDQSPRSSFSVSMSGQRMVGVSAPTTARSICSNRKVRSCSRSYSGAQAEPARSVG